MNKSHFGQRIPVPASLTLESVLEKLQTSLRRVEDNVSKKIADMPPPPTATESSKRVWENQSVSAKMAELRNLVGPFCVGLEPKLWLDDLLTYADQVKLGLIFVLKNIETFMDTSDDQVNDWIKRLRPTIAFLTQRDAEEKQVFEEFCELLQNAFSIEELREEAREKLERLYFKPGAMTVDDFVTKVVDHSRTITRSITSEQLVKLLKVKVPEEYRPFVDGPDVTNEYIFKKKLAMIVNAKLKFIGGATNNGSSGVIISRSSPILSRKQFIGTSLGTVDDLRMDN